MLGAAQLEKPSREAQEAIRAEGRLLVAEIRQHQAGDSTLDPCDHFLTWRRAWWRTRYQVADYAEAMLKGMPAVR